ncbi:AfsR/SARP family transcriptional regulator (plasmid) [Streptomyces sp. NBC_01343]|uniref:AfsR/SARP family transcriptional regulator n=1 Tax=Streptomyces sp. NBC_01343 TaxID=2903832 RepID=UPI002E0E8108|nr:AfsR/SARP family transcriptional regulator [Streptomyces sp. NBC_01343]
MDDGTGTDFGTDFRVLGPVEVLDRRTGTYVAPSGAKQRSLLGALVVRAGRVLPAERLIHELWGERPPAGAANALHAHVARLRRLLQDAAGQDPISTQATGYVLGRPGTRTDAHHFHDLSSKGRATLAADPVRAAELLGDALSLWRGPALHGSGQGPLCAREAERLEELRLTTLEILYEAHLRSGRHAEAARELERLTARHPVRERLYDLQMLALYRCGRQAEALGVYERARRRLVDELGVEPGPALRERMEAVLHHAPSLSAPEPDASLHELSGAIARLGTRIEALAREQQSLVRRLNGLTSGVALQGPPVEGGHLREQGADVKG